MENNAIVNSMHDAINNLLNFNPSSSYITLANVRSNPEFYDWFQNQSVADRLLDIPFDVSDKLMTIHLYCMGMMDDEKLSGKFVSTFVNAKQGNLIVRNNMGDCILQCLANKKLKSIAVLLEQVKGCELPLTNTNSYGIVNNELTSFWGQETSKLMQDCGVQVCGLYLPNNLFNPNEKKYVLDYIQTIGCFVHSQRYDIHKCQFKGKYLLHPSHANAKVRVDVNDFCDIITFPTVELMEMWWAQMKINYNF